MKKAIFFLVSVCLIVSSLFTMNASALYNSSVEGVETEIYYIKSLDTGAVLFEKDSTKQTSPASLTKLVTAVLAVENCKDLETVITVPEYCIRALDGTGSSVAGLLPGEQLTMRNLLYCLMVCSANDAAMVIADYIGGGSIEAFVGMMNSLAAQLGCKNSHFANPHGLDEEGHYSCAYDISVFAERAMESPVLTEIYSTTEYTLPATNKNDERVIRTTNFMLLRGYSEYYIPEAKGIKTGSTDLAGKCVVTTATKNGYSYLAVMMKAPYYDYDNDTYPENFAFMDAKKMLNWAFNNIKLKAVTDPTQIITVVDVKYSSSTEHVRLVPEKECVALVPVGVDAGSVLIEPVKETLPDSVDAPLKKGDPVCDAVVSYAGTEIARIKLVAAEDVSRNIFSFVFGKLGELFRTTGFKVFLVILVLVIAFFIGANVYVNRYRRRRRVRVVNYRDINRR